MHKMNTSIKLTGHATARCSQRGLSARDLELIELLGLEVPDGFLMCRRQAHRIAELLHSLAGRIEALAGARVVTESGRVVTAYRASISKQKALLRHAYDHAEAF